MPRKPPVGTGFPRPGALRAWSERPHESCPLCGLRIALVAGVLCRHTDTLNNQRCAASGLTLQEAIDLRQRRRAGRW